MNPNFPDQNPINYGYPNSPEHGGPRPMLIPMPVMPVPGNGSYGYPCFPAPPQNQGGIFQGPSQGVGIMPNANYNHSGYTWGHGDGFQPHHYRDTATAQVNTSILSGRCPCTAPNIMDDPIPPTVSPCQAVSGSGNTSKAEGRESHLKSPKGTSFDIEIESLTSTFDSTLNISESSPGQTDQRPPQTHQPRERLKNMFGNKHAGNPEDNGKGQLTEKGREHGHGNNRSCEGGQKIFSETKNNRETASARNECNDPTDDISYYSDRFLLTGLNDKVGQETLSDYVEVTSTCEVQKIEYLKNRSAAVITLTSTPDWTNMKKNIAKRKLEGNTVTCKCLQVSKNICVWNKITENNLKQVISYFESVKWGNRSVSLSMEDGYSVITFEDHSAVELVLSNAAPHVVSNIQLDVSAYYEGLGPVERMPRPIVEKEVRSLRVGEVKLLQITGFLNNLVKELEHLYKAPVLDEHIVLLKGEEIAVEVATQKLEMFKADVKTKWMSCSKAKIKYLDSIDGGETFSTKLQSEQVESAWTCGSKGIDLYSLSDSGLETAKGMIENHLKEDRISFCKPYSHSQKDVLVHLKSQFDTKQFCLLLEGNYLHVVALKDIFPTLMKETTDFLYPQPAEQKPAAKPKQQVVQLSQEEFQFMDHFKQERVCQFRKDMFDKFKMEIKTVDGKYVVIGDNADDVDKACKTMENFVRELQKEELCLDISESARLKQVGKISVLLDHIEKSQHCIISQDINTVWLPPLIRIEDENFGAVGVTSSSEALYGANMITCRKQTDHAEDVSKGKGRSQEEWTRVQGRHNPKQRSRRDRRFVHSDSCERKQHVQITLMKGEIAQANTDVIVNTVGPGMNLNGAISASIIKAGGSQLQVECKKYIDIKEGSYVMTGGGTLSCRKVFHCCLPFRTNTTAAQAFEDTVFEMLRDANTKRLRSIAFPALGTGGLNYDADFCAEILYTCVQKFEETISPLELKEVKLVLYPADTTVFHAFEKRDRVYRSQRKSEKSVTASLPPRVDKDMILPKIKVIYGELANQLTDVIVNTSNASLDLYRGAVSRSIREAAGFSVQSECNEFIRKSKQLEDGKFAVTGAGNLKCKKLYHCCLPNFRSTAIEMMSTMVQNILIKAAKHKTKSIAFPALGTGNLKYPPEKVAKVMFQTVHKFGIENPLSSIKEVCIVIFKTDDKVFKAFKEEEEHFYKSHTGSQWLAKVVRGSKSAPLYHGNATHSASNNAPPDYGPLLKVQVGSFTVRIKEGDISQEKNICIVNPINRDMNLHSGSVSRALYRRGGKPFMDKTNAEKNELSQNRVAVVTLPDGTGVLHLDREMISQNQQMSITMCLKHAKTEGYRSIAFPILQTGDAEKQMAKDLFKTLKKLTGPPDHHSCTATDVYVVIHKKSQADQFCQTFSELCKDGETAEQCQEQMTFSFLSDKVENVREAKRRLRNYCGSENVTEKIQIPTGITEDEVGSLGRRYDHTNITWLDNRWLQLKGNPANVSKTLEAFIKFLRGRSPVVMESDDNGNESSLFGDGESASRGIKHPAKITKEKISFTNEHFEKTGRNAYGSLPSETNEETEDRPLSLPTPMKHSWHGNSSEKLSEEGPDKEYSTWPCSDRESTMEVDETRNMVSDEGAKQMTQGPNRMKWLFLDPDTDEFEQYEDSISRDIETSYVNMKDKHELPEDADTGKQFIVDFKIMEEYPEGDPSDKVAVWRKEEISTIRATADTVMPSSWDPMDDGNIRVVQVKHSNESFEEVREEILKSCGNLDVSVVKVERVQNRDMFERYHAKKMMMDDESGETSEEKILWYGCEKTDSIVPINRYGVSLNHCRQEYGGPLGEGILFYKDFQNVVKRHVDGSQYAYFCRVLVGKYTKGEAGLRDPPPQPASEGSYYHSVVDNIDNPTTYAVFSDAQVYPNYLVTYRLIREEGAVKP